MASRVNRRANHRRLACAARATKATHASREFSQCPPRHPTRKALLTAASCVNVVLACFFTAGRSTGAVAIPGASGWCADRRWPNIAQHCPATVAGRLGATADACACGRGIEWLVCAASQAHRRKTAVDELPRRVVLRRALQITAALAVVPRIMRPAAAADSCVDPASESLRSSLHYASSAPNPKQTCGVCGFFTSDQAKPACGNCQIMSGPVDQGGHCDSWSARSG